MSVCKVLTFHPTIGFQSDLNRPATGTHSLHNGASTGNQ